MKRCIIITAYNPNGFPTSVQKKAGDFIICADSGYLIAKQQGLYPDIIIGDFDSKAAQENPLPEEDPYFNGVPVVHVPSEKDDTDTMLCIKHGLDQNCESFVLIGGIGGRLDHTIANIQSLAYLLNHGKAAQLIDPFNQIFIADPGLIKLPKVSGFKLSLFAYAPECKGITLSGTKYPLKDALLTNAFPLAISNEFSEATATISFTKGRLLVVLSRDK